MNYERIKMYYFTSISIGTVAFIGYDVYVDGVIKGLDSAFSHAIGYLLGAVLVSAFFVSIVFSIFISGKALNDKLRMTIAYYKSKNRQ